MPVHAIKAVDGFISPTELASGTPDGTKFLRDDHVWAVPAGGGGGVTDHGALTGLADDDHTQYHTDARGDARYSVLAHNHTGVYAPVLGVDDNYVTDAEKVKLTNLSGTNTGDQDLSGYSLTSHNHTGVYQPLATVLTNTTAAFTTTLETKLNGVASGAEVNVNADWNSASGDSQILNKPTLGTAAAAATGDFATSGHTHTGVYEAVGVAAAAIATHEGLANPHPGYLTPAEGDAAYSLVGHNHTGTYQPLATVLTNTTAAFTTAQETKLAGIETAATADMTGAEIVSAINSNLGGTTWQGGGGGGSVQSGTVAVDFGSFPGTTYSTINITGQTNITTNTLVNVWVRPTATATHSADEHIVDPPRVIAGDIVAGVGFTIHGFSTDTKRHHGSYTVAWRWE